MYRIIWSIVGAAPHSAGAFGSRVEESAEGVEAYRLKIRNRARFGDTVSFRVVAL